MTNEVSRFRWVTFHAGHWGVFYPLLLAVKGGGSDISKMFAVTAHLLGGREEEP